MNSQEYLDGAFDSRLRIGIVSSIEASVIRVNLRYAGSASGGILGGARYGLGEVGEFVLIEGEVFALLGRIVEVRLPERERRAVESDGDAGVHIDAIARVQLLGTVALDTLKVSTGVANYPRLGDRVYSAPISFLAAIPILMESKTEQEAPRVSLRLGHVNSTSPTEVLVTPDRIFGRHCAVLGATGGGKSFTVSRLIEECIRHKSKVILLDASGEYRGFSEHTKHLYLGNPSNEPEGAVQCSLPPSSFVESDFISLFQPAGRVQTPKFRAAIRSLRLVELAPELIRPQKPGLLVRANRAKQEILSVERNPDIAPLLENPATLFDVSLLASQIIEECVYEFPFGGGGNGHERWGGYNDGDQSYCMTLLTRINSVLASKALECVFGSNQGPAVTQKIEEFLGDDEKRLLRISLDGIYFEYSAREILANTLGRYLLNKARDGAFHECPVVVFVDEAHNFLGRRLGTEESFVRLDSFEIIAKEGRKYSLNLCLATQRPRDVTEGVLSQMGTLIVHRLTNDHDREVVERACGEIDRSASSFLPNLRPGEAAIIGVDFPIPMTIQVKWPATPPQSQGAQYQKHWARE